MQQTKWLQLCSILSIPSLGLIYGLLNYDNGSIYSMVTDFDKIIPFSKYFVIPYLLWYPFIYLGLIYLFLKSPKVYLNTLITINTGQLIAFMTYFLFQTTVPRPEVIGTDFFSELVNLLYTTDNPFNAFPSIHVLTTYALMSSIGKLEKVPRPTRIAVKALGVGIILSTQFVKQHVILDIVYAIIIIRFVTNLVEIAERGWPTWLKKTSLSWTMKSKLPS